MVKISSGAGHLWFLPMLFWCFVAEGILLNLCFKRLPDYLNPTEFERLNDEGNWFRMMSVKYLRVFISFLFLTIISLFPCPLPFGLGPAARYLVFLGRFRDVVVS